MFRRSKTPHDTWRTTVHCTTRIPLSAYQILKHDQVFSVFFREATRVRCFCLFVRYRVCWCTFMLRPCTCVCVFVLCLLFSCHFEHTSVCAIFLCKFVSQSRTRAVVCGSTLLTKLRTSSWIPLYWIWECFLFPSQCFGTTSTCQYSGDSCYLLQFQCKCWMSWNRFVPFFFAGVFRILEFHWVRCLWLSCAEILLSFTRLISIFISCSYL